jgi:hypothetical protein
MHYRVSLLKDLSDSIQVVSLKFLCHVISERTPVKQIVLLDAYVPESPKLTPDIFSAEFGNSLLTNAIKCRLIVLVLNEVFERNVCAFRVFIQRQYRFGLRLKNDIKNIAQTDLEYRTHQHCSEISNR